MANREEILKSINEKLEQLSDEQLEQVAGGTWQQTSDDAHFLHTLNPSFQDVTVVALMFEPGTSLERGVINEWKKYGVDYEWHSGAVYDNKYKINGKEVSRDEAYNHAKSIAWG